MELGDQVQLLGVLLEVAGALWLVRAAWRSPGAEQEAVQARVVSDDRRQRREGPVAAAARLANWKGAVGAGFVLVGLALQAAGLVLA